MRIRDISAIRQILNNAPESIPVPPELRHKRLEVIFQPLPDTDETTPSASLNTLIEEVRSLIAESPPVELGPFALDLSGFRFGREEANAR